MPATAEITYVAIGRAAKANTAIAKTLAVPRLVGAFLALGVGSAAAVDYGAPDICRLYGYAPHSADYRLCRANARHYWSTGECRHREYALAHADYCHLLPPPFLY
jgi:hypothetical protein